MRDRPRPAVDHAPMPAECANPDRCPACDEPIRGIVAADPGRHQFVTCGHSVAGMTVAEVADGRTVPVPAAGTVGIAAPVESSGSAGPVL